HNVVPDLLSRTVPNATSVVEAVATTVSTGPNIVEVCGPVRDRWYNKMVTLVGKNPLKFDKWRVEGTQLFKYPDNSKLEDTDETLQWKRVIPSEMRRDAIRSNHDPPECGHLGIFKTYNRLRALYYWP